MRYAIIFHGGQLYEGRTWRGVERRLRRDPWNHDFGRRAFRREMANRAKVWSGETVATTGTSEAFFEALESTGLLRMVRYERATTSRRERRTR